MGKQKKGRKRHTGKPPSQIQNLTADIISRDDEPTICLRWRWTGENRQLYLREYAFTPQGKRKSCDYEISGDQLTFYPTPPTRGLPYGYRATYYSHTMRKIYRNFPQIYLPNKVGEMPTNICMPSHQLQNQHHSDEGSGDDEDGEDDEKFADDHTFSQQNDPSHQPPVTFPREPMIQQNFSSSQHHNPPPPHLPGFQSINPTHFPLPQPPNPTLFSSSEPPNQSHFSGSQHQNAPHFSGFHYQNDPHFSGSKHPDAPHFFGSQHPNAPHFSGSQNQNAPHFSGSQHQNTQYFSGSQHQSDPHFYSSQHQKPVPEPQPPNRVFHFDQCTSVLPSAPEVVSSSFDMVQEPGSSKSYESRPSGSNKNKRFKMKQRNSICDGMSMERHPFPHISDAAATVIYSAAAKGYVSRLHWRWDGQNADRFTAKLMVYKRVQRKNKFNYFNTYKHLPIKAEVFHTGALLPGHEYCFVAHFFDRQTQDEYDKSFPPVAVPEDDEVEQPGNVRYQFVMSDDPSGGYYLVQWEQPARGAPYKEFIVEYEVRGNKMSRSKRTNRIHTRELSARIPCPTSTTFKHVTVRGINREYRTTPVNAIQIT